jgi:hypothetical protein
VAIQKLVLIPLPGLLRCARNDDENGLIRGSRELTGRARNHHVEQALVHADRDLGHLRQNELALDAKALVSASKGLIDTNFKLAVDVTTAILAAAGAGKLTPVDVSAAHNGATIATLLNDLRCGRCALPNE